MKDQLTCTVTGKEYPKENLTKGTSLRKPLLNLIQTDHPHFDESSWINNSSLNEYRKKYLEDMVKEEYGNLDQMEKDVISSITKNEILSTNVEEDMTVDLTTSQRISDYIASFGGSWTFIISFFSFIIVWILINMWMLRTNSFDPYPFILLNLILSCLAAIQAPIIMMSQNRKEDKDRKRSENDFKINLKAELEIRLLHDKIDHVIMHQNQKLLEIQQLQMDYMAEVLKEVKSNR
ncbi:MAG TPA: DUF1003 domain-containing protein [Cytophagaceae bacterium]|jgi:uncharacterized membrane protein|nr:DUF1003 domain-containing protein [Cytophagaceae bacterium]